MNHAITILAGVILVVAGGAASAQESPEYSAEFSACMDRSGGVTVEMRDCSTAEYERQDHALNVVYRDLMGRLGPELQTDLRTAQRAWIAFRKAECDYRHRSEGGTMGLLIYDSCWLDFTASRVVHLQSELATVVEYGTVD